MQFAVDFPLEATRELGRLTRFSLWCISSDGIPAQSIEVLLDGRPAYALRRSFRPDVGEAYRDFPLAGESGFFGDVLIPPDIETRGGVEIRLVARFRDGKQAVLMDRRFTVDQEPPPATARLRSYRLEDIIDDQPDGAAEPCGRRQEILGTPHFHPAGALPVLNLLETGPTHRYSESCRWVIDSVPNTGIFLDFGCGIKAPDDICANAVLLDAIHFPNVDVVAGGTRLPFRSSTFDGVISQAVFEHLPNPRLAAAELLRILKPGGLALINTAFLQPLRLDPSHYFNMTSAGLRLVLGGFEIIDEGSRVGQFPSRSLAMQIDSILPWMRRGIWRSRLEELLAELKSSGGDLDSDLGPIGRKILAAGVYALARKPRQSGVAANCTSSGRG